MKPFLNQKKVQFWKFEELTHVSQHSHQYHGNILTQLG